MEDMNRTTQVREWMHSGDAKINNLILQNLQKKKKKNRNGRERVRGGSR
jgi:hypothetical protein